MSRLHLLTSPSPTTYITNHRHRSIHTPIHTLVEFCSHALIGQAVIYCRLPFTPLNLTEMAFQTVKFISNLWSFLSISSYHSLFIGHSLFISDGDALEHALYS